MSRKHFLYLGIHFVQIVTRAVTKYDFNNPAITLTETNILYTDGCMDGQSDTWRTDKLIPVYPRKHLLCGV